MEIKNKQSILKLPLLLLIGVVLFSLGVNAATAASVPTDNSTIYVNNTTRKWYMGRTIQPHIIALVGPKKTISNATGTVTTNGTIYIASGIYKESKIKITTNMTHYWWKPAKYNNWCLRITVIYFDITPGNTVHQTLINLTLENGL